MAAPNTHHINLSCGPNGGQYAGIWIAFGAMACCFPPIEIVALTEFLEGPSAERTGNAVIAFAILLLYGVLVILTVVKVTFMYQRKFWLWGNVLVQRRVFDRRSWDLSQEQVVIGQEGLVTGSLGVQVPALYVGSDPAATARLWREGAAWGNSHRMIPAHELRALADAVSARGNNREAAQKLRNLSDSLS